MTHVSWYDNWLQTNDWFTYERTKQEYFSGICSLCQVFICQIFLFTFVKHLYIFSAFDFPATVLRWSLSFLSCLNKIYVFLWYLARMHADGILSLKIVPKFVQFETCTHPHVMSFQWLWQRHFLSQCFTGLCSNKSPGKIFFPWMPQRILPFIGDDI